MPCAVTPISRRVPSSVHAAEPCSVYSSWVWMPDTGAGLCSGKRASMLTSARRAFCRARTSWAMCSASVSALNVDSPRTTSPIASLTTSSKRDMCAPFWLGPSSTTHSKRAENSCSVPFCWIRITFSTPVTPTRERLSWTDGRRAWTSVMETLGEGCVFI